MKKEVIKVPASKARSTVAQSLRGHRNEVFKDRKKEARKNACRSKEEQKD